MLIEFGLGNILNLVEPIRKTGNNTGIVLKCKHKRFVYVYGWVHKDAQVPVKVAVEAFGWAD